MFKNKKIVRRFNKNYFFKLFEFFGNFFMVQALKKKISGSHQNVGRKYN